MAGIIDITPVEIPYYGTMLCLENDTKIIAQSGGVSIIVSENGGQFIEKYADGNPYAQPRLNYIDSRGHIFFSKGLAGDNGYVVMSIDNGETWVKVLDTKTISPGLYSNALWYMAEDSEGSLYASEYSFGTPGETEGAIGRNIYKSIDGGATWAVWYTYPDTIRHIHLFAIDSSNTFYLSCAHPTEGATDNPNTFVISSSAVLGPPIPPFGVGNGLTAFVEADNGDLFFGSDSQDGIWKLVNDVFVKILGDKDYPGMFSNVLGLAKGRYGVLYATVNENGRLLASADDGLSWSWLRYEKTSSNAGEITVSKGSVPSIYINRGPLYKIVQIEDYTKEQLKYMESLSTVKIKIS